MLSRFSHPEKFCKTIQRIDLRWKYSTRWNTSFHITGSDPKFICPLALFSFKWHFWQSGSAAMCFYCRSDGFKQSGDIRLSLRGVFPSHPLNHLAISQRFDFPIKFSRA